MRRRRALLLTTITLCAASAAPLLLATTTESAGAAAGSGPTYTAATPLLDRVAGGPWNTSQGDPSAGATYPLADLLPTFVPGGPTTSLGGVVVPNVAVYPSAAGATPYPSGVAGTPGPLPGYCSSLGPNPETGTNVPQPAGFLPMAPYYFPDVVRNSDGSLTGYFDYRPKDADEAITVAKSTDNGASWTTEGEALDQNPGYCPTADTNDDGQGHPFVTSIAGTTNLYTLQRPAGDNTGVGLLVHQVAPAATNPLATLPAAEPVGIDPNTFATAGVSVPTGATGVTIPVSTLGSAGSPQQIVAGPYEDANAPSPSSTIITCTGTGASSLTGCTVAGSSALTIHPNDDLVQVIATANPGTGSTYTIPRGPNSPDASGGLATVKILNGTSVGAITTYILNNNAPNRLYIDGDTVYCAQSNANPTNKIENCTTTASTALTVHQGDAITADPIVPPSATMTTGLIAPDGIVGTLRSYPGAPAGSTVVLYTEKLLDYFIVGTTNGFVDSGNAYHGATIVLPATTINFSPSATTSEPLPSGPITIYLGTAVGQPIQQVTCSGVVAATQSGVPAGSENLTGCTGGTGSVAVGNWLGGPNASVVPYSTLSQIGEGSNGASKGPEKLFANNEDLTVLRAAYTTDGVHFSDLGAISGSTSGTGNDTGSYDDVSNPLQSTSPSATSPTNLAPGSPDTIELRFVGSRGTIITNPDGSYGMFLSGAWATDGDSDAFNQIFYTSSVDGQHWSVPRVVLSTDYTFAASAAQANAAPGTNPPLGLSAYYSGRAYGPAVVQNPNGSLTMVFSGYRLPKPITNAGTQVGTNPAALYTVGATDPALYRDILTVTLSQVGPVSTAALTPAPTDGFYNANPTVTLSATDTGGPGIRAIYYQVDNQGYQQYGTPFTISGDGTHQLNYYAVDANGVTETLHTQYVMIDTTPPVTTASVSPTPSSTPQAGTVNGPATVTLSATDSLPGPATPHAPPWPPDQPSGVAVTQYQINGGAWQTYTGPFQISAGGATTVGYRSIDNAGNTEATHLLTLQINPQSSQTYTGAVPAQVALSVAAGAPNPLGNWSFIAGAAGTYTTSIGATATSTATQSALTAVDPSSQAPGHLVNGSFALAQALELDAVDTAHPSPVLQPLGASPITLIAYNAPVAGDAVTIGAQQSIAATDPLHTGAYAKTVVFTLSVLTP